MIVRLPESAHKKKQYLETQVVEWLGAYHTWCEDYLKAEDQFNILEKFVAIDKLLSEIDTIISK